MTGEGLKMAKDAMDGTVAYAETQGDKQVYRFDFPPQDGSLGIGLHGHPTLRQHTKMADELTAYLKELMKW